MLIAHLLFWFCKVYQLNLVFMQQNPTERFGTVSIVFRKGLVQGWVNNQTYLTMRLVIFQDAGCE